VFGQHRRSTVFDFVSGVDGGESMKRICFSTMAHSCSIVSVSCTRDRGPDACVRGVGRTDQRMTTPGRDGMHRRCFAGGRSGESVE